MYINFFKRINSKNKLNTYKNNHISNIHNCTPWETLEKFRFTLPHFTPLSPTNINNIKIIINNSTQTINTAYNCIRY